MLLGIHLLLVKLVLLMLMMMVVERISAVHRERIKFHFLSNFIQHFKLTAIIAALTSPSLSAGGKLKVEQFINGIKSTFKLKLY